MADLTAATGELVLYTCHIDRGGPPLHACKRAHDALEEAGHEYRTEVLARNRPFGLGTKGRRPELKALSGQEKLPVLKLPDGKAVNGSRDIMKWARENAPRPS
jgi:glutathione S-transferase